MAGIGIRTRAELPEDSTVRIVRQRMFEAIRGFVDRIDLRV